MRRGPKVDARKYSGKGAKGEGGRNPHIPEGEVLAADSACSCGIVACV